MQAKDVPDLPILAFLDSLYAAPATCFPGHTNSVQRAMPPDTPPKVVLAKMRSLIKRGVVRGCACGCRGDFYPVNPSTVRATP